MDVLTNFYDRLFIYYYNLKKNSDDTPQYFPIIIISTGQAANLFFFVILFAYFLRVDYSVLLKIFLILDIGMVIFNFYVYQIKDRKEIVLKKNLKLSLRFKIFSYFYMIISLLSPLLLIYFFNEFGKGF